MKNEGVICVVPAYNEADIISETINSIKEINEIDKIIVVNDGSTDDTGKVLENIKGITVLENNQNRGKGYSIKKIINDYNFKVLILIDGDLGATAREVNKLLKPVIYNGVDITIAKFPEAKTVTNKKGGIGLVKGLAKKGILFFTGKEIYTSLSGQRVYSRDVISKIDYIPDRYGIEVAMTIQSLNAGYKIKEIPVNMTHRYTERNLRGFLHRGKQFKDILKTFIIMYIKGYKRRSI